MKLARYQTTCTQRELIANDIYELRFTRPEGFLYEAGQFVMWDVPLVADATDVQARAYSIASSPREDDLLFVVKYQPGGRASEWIKQQLTVGTELEFQGPLGVFTLDIHTKKDIVMICTSTGNAPFRGMLHYAMAHEMSSRIDLIYGVRSETDLFWAEEFNRLAHEYTNVHVHITLTQPSDTWIGERGRVQGVVDEVCPTFENRCVYICGNPEMTQDIKRICLEAGVEKGDLHVEEYV